MSLTVPMSVRLATSRQDIHVTRDVRELSFRSVVPGGFASLQMSLDRPLHIRADEIDYYAGVYVYGPDGQTIWEGRLEDPGRGASSDGVVWDIAAVGPSAHAEDLRRVLFYIDQSAQRWERLPGTFPALETSSQGGNEGDAPGWRFFIPRGTVVPIGDWGGIHYTVLTDAGMYIAAIDYVHDSGVNTAAGRQVSLFVSQTADGVDTNRKTILFSTAGPTAGSDSYTLPFLLFDHPSFRLTIGGSAFTISNDDTWMELTSITVVTLRLLKDGRIDTTTSNYHSADFVLSSEVVEDLLGRMLPGFDGPNATVTTSLYHVTSLAYPDGATARDVLDELMALEPAFYWAAWESGPGARVPRLFAVDTFSREITNSWTSTDNGLPWVLAGGTVPDEYDVSFFPGSFAAGRQTISTVNALRTSLVDAGTTDGTAEISLRWLTSVGLIATPTGAPFTGWLMGRANNTSNFYAAQVSLDDNNDEVILSIVKRVSNVFSTIAGPITVWSGFAGAGSPPPIHIVLSVEGSTVKARAWTDEQNDPVGWILTVTDTDLTTGTRWGPGSRLDSGNTNSLPIVAAWSNFRLVGQGARNRFEWVPWPSTVRYEADAIDGFESPGSASNLYDRVVVRYKDNLQRTKIVRREKAVSALDGAGRHREAFIDIGEGRSNADAVQAGDSFLQEHNMPPNAGRLTVSRPIMDFLAGRMVQPYEIRPGSLIRVRGVLPRVDSLNATDRDGVTIYRIVAVTYDASSGSAELELDSYPLTVAQALAALRRGRGAVTVNRSNWVNAIRSGWLK